MRVGSCATRSREPSQVRKEAALSGPSRVPQGCLTRADDEYDLMAPVSTAGARSSTIRSLPAAGDTPAAGVRSLASVSTRCRSLATACTGPALARVVDSLRSLATACAGPRGRAHSVPLRSPGASGRTSRRRPPRLRSRRSDRARRAAAADAPDTGHERRRGERSGHRRAGRGVAQASERRRHRGGSGRQPDRGRRPCQPRSRVDHRHADDDGERLSARLR